jgi:hypothetical protein
MLSVVSEVMSVDVSGFKPATPKETAPRADVRKIAEAHDFPSRESRPALKARRRRNYTGRDQQLNVKATAEVIARFLAIADRERWVLGKTLEHAVDALEKSLEAASGQGKGPLP